MARFKGPRGKICRRLEFQAFESPKFASPTKNYPPGQHGPSYRRRPSEYGLQLKEKQKMKYLYGVLEKQFRNYFKKANKQVGITGHNLVVMLESRLDNTVYRLGFARTRRQARQLVTHGHFLVNNRKVNIPSYQMKPGDMIKVREKSKKLEFIHDAMRRVQGEGSYPWLKLDKANMEGIYVEEPARDQVHDEYNEQLVVELYSK
ncbi:MAG: 30S ribosomal protein S4 [Candidatus Marinimicrobia bacterium]|nr:30S ribosomal protein S4 [Candidatus Neomarinimicrobiota bacterium]MCF7851480.1 30S ribosomal protein S4 [Candidatus Neomarinimicrobiota bacterium]MCF7904739.1 30S ribosomal protein S4 [Candidatus Neomarinimicrobiota bacterium]